MSESTNTADAGAGVVAKRPAVDELQEQASTKLMKSAPSTTGVHDFVDSTPHPPTISTVTVLTKPDGTTVTTTTVTTTVDNSKKGREVRLEQNRKAACESRKRKKVMVEELQRSVVFFSRANNTLKEQNEKLTHLLLTAQEHAKKATTGTDSIEVKTEAVADVPTDPTAIAAAAVALMATSSAEREASNEQQTNATIVATQALLESQGFPAAAARAAAQAMNSTGSATMGFDNFTPTSRSSNAMMVPPPPMQPGATMQAMANFQQAAAAAMQAALQGMTGINGLSLLQSVLQPPPGSMTQHSFTDTMTAIAMQQAAAQHMEQQQQQMLLSTAIAANQTAAVASKATEVVTAVMPMTNPGTATAEPKAQVPVVETKQEDTKTDI